MDVVSLAQSSAAARTDKPWDFRSMKANKVQQCMVRINEGTLLSEVFPKDSNLRIKLEPNASLIDL